ncbi:MAG: urease accessory protein UreD [Pseudomonadales bacterium]
MAEGWSAKLSLSFERALAKTNLRVSERVGPLSVQRPFYPEEDVCHAYVLHPPGGVVGGDQLELNVQVRENGSALITTPAANKIYRSNGPESQIKQQLSVESGGTLEWLPQETILFGGSSLSTCTRVNLNPSARFSGWDMIVLGRPFSGDRYERGAFDQKMTIAVADKPILNERHRWRCEEPMLGAAWGCRGNCALASVYAYPADADLLKRVQRLIAPPPVDAGATLLGQLLVVRVLGSAPQIVRTLAEKLWTGIRPLQMGRAASRPRIWST